jgi:TATA-box binding protein (TBP) (component of TFIID and TFIIIB)
MEYDDMMVTMKYLQSLPRPTPNPLSISTRSAKCSLTKKVDIAAFVEWLKEMRAKNEPIPQLVQCLYGDFAWRPELIVKKERVNSKKKVLFYNQATIIIDLQDGKNPVNIKCFINGGISIVGCKSEMGGRQAVDVFLHILKVAFPETYADLDAVNYEITCINSDFNVNFRIDRTNLYNVLNTTKYYCDFDPCRYPGVEIIYKYHIGEPNEKQDGICNCFDKMHEIEWVEKKPRKVPQKKKKTPEVEEIADAFSYLGHYPTLEKSGLTSSGSSSSATPFPETSSGKEQETPAVQMKKVQKKKECKCKNVTIFVFQSGSVIITGSNTMEQLTVAHEFINSIFDTYFYQVRKIMIQDCQQFVKDLCTKTTVEELKTSLTE